MRKKRPTRVSSAVLSVVHRLDRPFQSSKTMMNPKLFVFIIAIPIFTLLTVDWYQSQGFDVTEDVTPNQCGVPNKKLICLKQLSLLFRAFLKLPEVSKAEFNQLCKNVTKVHDNIPKAKLNTHFDLSNIDGRIDHAYYCMLPFYTIPFHSCQLAFDDAIQSRNCYFDARSQYYGSPDEAICRETCCPDSSTCGADGVVEKNTLCKNPVLNQTLKDNGCLEACMARFMVQYGKQHCRSGAVRVFEGYIEETRKKFLTDDQCFMECPHENKF